jgi:two-component system response regulator WspF
MRVAIVNDLALAREVLRRLVVSAPDHSIAWTAAEGAEAVRKAAADRPDVILMDLVMPVMDGAEATRRIMADSPCPILLVTSSVTGNFTQVYTAMGHGALDAVNTPTFGPDGKVRDGEGLLARLAKLMRAGQAASPIDAPCAGQALGTGQALGAGAPTSPPAVPTLVALGASTGGPEAVARILTAFPADLPAAVVVVQHIAAEFAPSLATWLQGRTRLRVRLALAGDRPALGQVLVAGSNDHLVLASDRRLIYTPEPVEYPYRPSVDAFLASLAASWPRAGVAALLTGMGADGACGLLRLRQAGWLTLAQDKETSVVYGMPQAAVKLGAACQILPVGELAPVVLAYLARQTTCARRSDA